MEKHIEEIDSVTIRFAGDSGDGMQLTGNRFAMVSAAFGEDVVTLADFPAEIRAPAGTVAGVSGFQLNLSGDTSFTPGDKVDMLIAMNPAALKVSLHLLKENGSIIIDENEFHKKSLEKAGFDQNPLEGDFLRQYRLYKVPITDLTRNTLKDLNLSQKEIDRCKNFYVLGIACWLYSRPSEPVLKWIEQKFKKEPDIMKANNTAFSGGWNYAECSESFTHHFVIHRPKKAKQAGIYRYVSGNTSIALGLMAAAHKADLPLFLGSYPITPATDILQELSKYKHFHVTTFQAEDEIAAIGSAIGAAFAGSLSATSTSGPGLALKSEFINLAVMTELPLVIIDVQRAGPSTGLPTKTEQSDLLQSLWGRNGESPIAVLAARSPADCFDVAFEASRIALTYMTPVIVLSDSFLANSGENWKIPSAESLAKIYTRKYNDKEHFKPYLRDPETLARPWAIPGTANHEHRIGGLEKENVTGMVSHNPENHHQMVSLRAQKIHNITQIIPPSKTYGKDSGDILVVGWGSTYGAIYQAVENMNHQGFHIGGIHLRYLNPLPADLPSIFKRYKKILLPENNLGQLSVKLRSEYLLPIESFNRVTGLPMKISEIEKKIHQMLEA